MQWPAGSPGETGEAVMTGLCSAASPSSGTGLATWAHGRRSCAKGADARAG